MVEYNKFCCVLTVFVYLYCLVLVVGGGGDSAFRKIKMYEDLCCIQRSYLSLLVMRSIAGKRPRIVNVF